VTGNGWYLTKHSAAVLAGVPCGEPAEVEVPPRVGSEPIAVVGEANGAATLEAYTVLYDRQGAPIRGIGIGRTAAGERFVANTPEDRDVLEHLVAVEGVGLPGRVHHTRGANVFEP
jgi:acetyl-CoA C-acetyltransferase